MLLFEGINLFCGKAISLHGLSIRWMFFVQGFSNEKDNDDTKAEVETEGNDALAVDGTAAEQASNQAVVNAGEPTEVKSDLDKKRSHEEITGDEQDEGRETKKRMTTTDEELPVQEPPKNASRALKVEGFVRPFTLHQARHLFESHGTLAAFWMPSIKNVAYAVFSSKTESLAAFDKLNDLRWPADSPKRLAPKFITIVEAENAIKAGENNPDFSIERVDGDDVDIVEVKVAEEPEDPLSEQKANSPDQEDLRNIITKRQEMNAATMRGGEGEETEGLSLDDLFKRTHARPAIYWMPLSEEEAGRKES